MKTLILSARFCALFLIAFTSLVFGQATGSVSLQKKDGTVVTGRIRAQSDDDVTVESAVGFVTVSKAQLTTESVNLITEPTVELTTLRERVAQQEKVIAALRSENQALRAALANQPAVSGTSPTASVTATVPANTPVGQALSHWMSSTGKRHNSNCRYYGSGKGRPCGAQDGVACKICGG